MTGRPGLEMASKLVADLEAFEREANTVYSTLVLPNWGGELHGFPHTLYGYMMLCFASIDLFSTYWRGNASPNGQTKRMVNFMQTYLSPNRESCNVAVQMWRHKLMHTGQPRFLVDERTGKTYRWLLHWWEHLPANQHFTFSETADSKVLNIGLIYLISDLKTALEKCLADLSGDAELEANFEKSRTSDTIRQVQTMLNANHLHAICLSAPHPLRAGGAREPVRLRRRALPPRNQRLRAGGWDLLTSRLSGEDASRRAAVAPPSGTQRYGRVALPDGATPSGSGSPRPTLLPGRRHPLGEGAGYEPGG